MKLPLHYQGYIIKRAIQSGGKAGKGRNKTSTVQILDETNYTLVKHFRYKVNDPHSFERACNRAFEHVRDHLIGG